MLKIPAPTPFKILADLVNILLFGAGILALSHPAQAQETGRSLNLGCIVAKEDAEGEWVASRYLDVSNGSISPSRDSYEWHPKEHVRFDPGMTLKWGISYYWPVSATMQKNVPEDDVVVSLRFWYDAKKSGGARLNAPERSLIHLYRSTSPEEEFSFTSVSLTTVMLWQKHNNGNVGTQAHFPLDDLLAFGTGFDTLVWNIRTEPNQYGGTHALAKGLIPIASLRGRVSEIPKLRRMLDKKAANFRTECHAPIFMSTDAG